MAVPAQIRAAAAGLAEAFKAASPARQAPPSELDGLTLERLVADKKLGAFNPSPVQRALIRAAAGEDPSDLLRPDQMETHFGVEQLPSGRGARVAPLLMILRTGVRAGKSFLSAMALLHSLLTCAFRRDPDPMADPPETPDEDGQVGVRKGERVRALIVAPVLELAKAVFAHLVGTMQASPVLAKLFVDKPLVESCKIRRPDGFVVHVELVAASSGGTNLRSTWLAGAVIDEAAFFDDAEGAVNLESQINAVKTRLLPGAQAWVVSSPWSDADPFHELFTEEFGKPGQTVAFHSDSRSMNPTLDRNLEKKERERNPENAAREYDAIPLPSASTLFFPPDMIAKSVNTARVGDDMHLPPLPGVAHFGGSDLGFRKNSSAFALSRFEEAKVRVAYHEEVRPGVARPGASAREKIAARLKPSEICAAFCRVAWEYECTSVRGDMHYADTAHEEFAKEQYSDDGDLEYDGSVVYEEWDPKLLPDVATEFRRLGEEGLLELPNDARLIAQMKGTTWKAVPGGAVKIILPKQGNSHGDLLMAVMLSATQPPLEDVAPEEYEDDYRIVRAGKRRW